MSGPVQFVSPTNDGFAGGGRFAAGVPTAVGGGGASRASTGTGPPGAGVGPAEMQFARNNRGSNVRIPYSRLVPMRSLKLSGLTTDKANAALMSGVPPEAFDMASHGGVHKRAVDQFEGLDVGRVAFIQGKRRGSMEVTDPDIAMQMDISTRYGAVHATGVDRMQNLASFEWMFMHFAQTLHEAEIDLSKVTTESKEKITGLPKMFLNPGTEHNLVEMDDIAWYRAKASTRTNAGGPNAVNQNETPSIYPGVYNVGKRILQGFVTTDISPFLHTRGQNPRRALVDRGPGGDPVLVSRFLGDELANALLEAELAKKGFFDWTPDGLVLSKLANGPDSLGN